MTLSELVEKIERIKVLELRLQAKGMRRRSDTTTGKGIGEER